MRFNPKARLDTSRVRDRGRASGGGSGGRRTGGSSIPIPGGLKAGGGLLGVVIVVIFLVVTQFVGGGSSGAFDTSRMTDTGRYDNCKTGTDANSDPDCARVAVENSLYDFWASELGSKFQPEQAVVTFGNAIDTGCGQATSDVGPFYCPTDQTIYLDTTFFEAILQGQLAGPSGAFVEPYVLAHEYGHHIQNLLGTMGRVKTQQGPKSDSVRLELQADCFAGMWARAATTTQDADGNVLFTEISDEDVQNAIDAATSVGDDRIQQQSGGKVNPEQWTHGSSAERVKWFKTGFTTGSLRSCDTFATDNL
jgi:predicted metalloprotease